LKNNYKQKCYPLYQVRPALGNVMTEGRPIDTQEYTRVALNK